MNDQLYIFLKDTPLIDENKYTAAEEILNRYISQKCSFEEFLMIFTQFVNFEKISPLKLILKMTIIPSNDDMVQKLVYESSKYIPIIIQFPNFLDCGYNSGKLFNDFISFIHDLVYQYENETNYAKDKQNVYLKNIIDFCLDIEENTLDFFLILLNHFAYRFTEALLPNYADDNDKPLTTCLCDLASIREMIESKRLCTAFCESEFFFDIMSSFFSKSVLPGSYENPLFFGHKLELHTDNQKIATLEHSLNTYYTIVKDIIVLLCNSGQTCLSRTIEFIRYFINQNLSAIEEDSSLEKGMALLNFEAVMIEIALKAEGKSDESAPYIPYMDGSMTPFSNEKDFTLSSVYNWLKCPNINEGGVKYIFEEEQDKKEYAEWNTILQQRRSQKINRQVFNFFFAAAKTISISSSKLMIKIHQHDCSNLSEIDNLILEKKKNIYHVLLCLPSKYSQIIRFMECVLDFILTTGGYDQTSGQMPSHPSIAYQHLPDYLLGSCIVIIRYYNAQLLSDDKLNRLLFRISIFLMNKRLVINPIITSRIIKNFADMPCNQIDDFDYSVNQVFPYIMDYYPRADKIFVTDDFQKQIELKVPCINLIERWLVDGQGKEFIKNNNDNPAFINLFYSFSHDMELTVQNCFNTISQIQVEQAKVQSIKDKDDSLLIKYRTKLKFFFSIIKKLFFFFNTFTKIALSAFNNEQIASQFASLTFSVFSKVIQPKELVIDNPTQIIYDPNYFIRTFSFLSYLIRNNQVFMKKLSDLLKGPNSDLCEKVHKELEQIAQLSNKDKKVYDSFTSFVEAINQMK